METLKAIWFTIFIGSAFCWASISVNMISNAPANTEASEAVFLGGLSSEQALCQNPCALDIYILILSWQDVWTNTEDKKIAVSAAMCSGVAVLQLHQEAGSHAYMPSY
jgi:hypothetical protein